MPPSLTDLSLRSRVPTLLILIMAGLLLGGCSSTGTAMKASPTLANALGIADIPVAQLERDYADETSKFVDINGYRIHYRDQGQGEPIVLLHGVFSSLHTWDDWIPALSENYRVISLDLPGFGLTGAPEDISRFDEGNVIDTFARFVDRLKLGEITLIGNSFGGLIAADYAAEYGSRVEKLILISPFGYPQELPWQMQVATFGPVAFLSNYVQSPVTLVAALRDAYGDPRRFSEADAFRYVHMSQRPGARQIYTKTLQLIKDRAENTDPRPFYQIRTPTLLMWGEADERVPVSLAEIWQRDIRNTALVTYPGVGHMPMEEAPKQSLADVLTFLADGLTRFQQQASAAGDTGTTQQ